MEEKLGKVEENLRVLVDALLNRIEFLEEYVDRLPTTFMLKYKPPGDEEHLELADVLDDLYMKINRIEALLEEHVNSNCIDR